MKNHTLNLFKVANLHELDFSYKIVQFDLLFIEGKEDVYNKQMQKVAQKVASLTAGPTAIVKRAGTFFIAIPADRNLDETKVDIVPFTVTVKMQPLVYKVNAAGISSDNVDVVMSFLDFEIRRQLSNHSQLWRLTTNQFYLKKPALSAEQSTVDVFSGFIYKLVRLADGYFYICLDLATKYIDRHYLSQYVNLKNAGAIGSSYRGKRALYQNGDDWYTTEIVGFGRQISEHEFMYDGETNNVFDYVSNKTKQHKFQAGIHPEDITLLYKYPSRSMEPHCGASSLAKILYSTNDTEVKGLHRQSIKEPNKRFDTIKKYIAWYFSDLRFNSKPLNIYSAPIVEDLPYFVVPSLKFNNNRHLQVIHDRNGGNTKLRDFGSERKQFINDNGILNKSIFDEQFLIVPHYLEKELVDGLKRNAEQAVRKLAPMFRGFNVIKYQVKEGSSATFQVQEIEKLLTKHNAKSGFALFVLPDLTQQSRRHIKNFHDCLKSKFYPDLKVQCASALKIRSYFSSYPNPDLPDMIEYRVPSEKQSGFRSYMFNLAMEHLIINRKWPFALTNSQHYDIYIGVDVHERFAGFTFFFKNGENILFFPVEVPKKNKSQRAEKLKAALLYKIMLEKLKQFIPLYAPDPNAIIIVRDGRSFGEEEKALQKVITTLGMDGDIKADSVKYGVVDLHKQSAVPLRAGNQTNRVEGLENPLAGSYKIFNNDKEGFLFNTGYPFQIPGSAKPLHLSLKAGNVTFLKVMEDIFGQSMLAFSAPDRSNALPITIKLIDTLLEPLSVTLIEEVEEDEYDEILIP